MSNKITWWPSRIAESTMFKKEILLVRHDWPDERIYQVCLYDPQSKHPWTDGHGGIINVPDYWIPIDQIVEFISIPSDREYTYDVRQISVHESSGG